MLNAVRSAGPLLLGIALIMMGNGLQSTLLGVRASSVGFGSFVTGLVMTSYYVGFLVGALVVPRLVQRVGHIRVFTALASVASAAVLAHFVLLDPVAWAAQLEELQPKLRAALEENRDFETPGEVSIPLALTILLAEGGDPDGVAQLAEMTGLSDDLDPEGKYRLYAAFALGKVGSGLAGPERTTASRALVRLLNESPDLGIRVIAAAGLQRLPTEEGRAALVEALRDPALELRGSAALSLGELGDPSGVPVLREMVQVAAYDSERGVSAQKWSLPDRVSESRCKALLALSKLNQAPGPEELRQMADEDPDVNVRETALRLLAEDSGG